MLFERNTTNQVIQVVTFSSPILGGHLAPWKGHVTIPKRSPAELPGSDSFSLAIHIFQLIQSLHRSFFFMRCEINFNPSCVTTWKNRAYLSTKFEVKSRQTTWEMCFWYVFFWLAFQSEFTIWGWSVTPTTSLRVPFGDGNITHLLGKISETNAHGVLLLLLWKQMPTNS